MNEIFVKTAKAESEGINLSNDLKRVLSFMDGKSRSGELSKRAPPSLRKKWGELIGELVEGGFIVYNHETNIDRKPIPHELDLKEISVPKSGAAAPVNELDYRRMSAAARVVAELEAAAAVKAKADIEAKAEAEAKQKAEKAARAAELEAAAAAREASVEAKAKTEAEAQQRAEKTARAAELKAFFATAKEKTKAEAKQAKQEAARIHAEQEAAAAAAAAAKEKSETEAKAKADAKQRIQEAERNRADLEAAILAAKTKADVKVKTRQEAEVQMPVVESGGKLESRDANPYTWRGRSGGVNSSDPQRLQDLETENAGLKKLLVDAHMEIEALKSSFGVKQ